MVISNQYLESGHIWACRLVFARFHKFATAFYRGSQASIEVHNMAKKIFTPLTLADAKRGNLWLPVF